MGIFDVFKVKGLIEALKDKDWCVRDDAAEALGSIGDRRTLEPLNMLLEDGDSDVQSWAAWALENIGRIKSNLDFKSR